MATLCFSDMLVPLCADGLFGQCQAPHQEPVQYQVSVQVLHKLQDVLKDLMVQGESFFLRKCENLTGERSWLVFLSPCGCAGLTWRDDVTQSIISRELSHIPTVDSLAKLHEKSPKQ